MNVILCGMMGCGKTTVAREMAEAYNLMLVDTDSMIVERYGDIDGIFKRFGEQYFRDIESAIVKEVAARYDGAVISLGGGCVLRDENVIALKSCGKIVYLRTRAQTIIERLKGDSTRPLLAGGLEEKVNSILSARSHIYEAAADIIVDTDGVPPRELATRIKEMLK